jgi:hypothetical protein
MSAEELRRKAERLYVEAAEIYSGPIWRADVLQQYYDKYAEAYAADMAFRDAQFDEWAEKAAAERAERATQAAQSVESPE